MQDSDNKIVNSLWIGGELSSLELLTLASFTHYGHHFRLWVYEPFTASVPVGVEICDATQILPRSAVFSYQHQNAYGHGQGSVAGFSDIFRYKLLYDKGGWWVDMDVLCLRPFHFTDPYYFRSHDKHKVVGNVMKCPAHSVLMSKCYEEAIRTVNAENKDWDLPICILNEQIEDQQLGKYINTGQGNFDSWQETSRYIFSSAEPPADWYFIHWQNEEWRMRKIPKDRFYWCSYLAGALEQYGIISKPENARQKLKSTALMLRYAAQNPYVFLLSHLGR